MSHKPSVLIVGIGEVGRYILEFLARDNTKINIVAADLHLPDVEAKINNAILGAAFQSRYPDVKALEIDLFDLERTADILNEPRLSPTPPSTSMTPSATRVRAVS